MTSCLYASNVPTTKPTSTPQRPTQTDTKNTVEQKSSNENGKNNTTSSAMSGTNGQTQNNTSSSTTSSPNGHRRNNSTSVSTNSETVDINGIVVELEKLSAKQDAQQLVKLISKLKRLSSNQKSTLLSLSIQKLKTSSIKAEILEQLMSNAVVPTEVKDIYAVLKVSLFPFDTQKPTGKKDKPFYETFIKYAINKDTIVDVFNKAITDSSKKKKQGIFVLAHALDALQLQAFNATIAHNIAQADEERKLEILELLYDTNIELFKAVLDDESFVLTGDSALCNLLKVICAGRSSADGIPAGLPSFVASSLLFKKYDIEKKGDVECVEDVMWVCQQQKNKTDNSKERTEYLQAMIDFLGQEKDIMNMR